MKKTIKMFSILLMTIVLLVSFSTVVSAEDPDGSVSSIISSLNSRPSDGVSGQDEIVGLGRTIIGAVNVVGIVVAVVVLLVLGIKYMTGSVEEKAEYKKTFIPYLVGALLIFGATTLVNVIVQLTTISIAS